MAASSDWTDMELLVTVKAYPSVSQTYGEAVCVAGIRLDSEEPEWVRLFPVQFRDLPRVRQFEKWQVIRLAARTHSTDLRPESWRPDPDSIERFRLVPAGGHWPERRRLIEPLLGPTMCELNVGRAGGGHGPSLGLVRAEHVVKLRVEEAGDWSIEQRGQLAQANLLSTKTTLEKPGHNFAYHWICAEPGCPGHTQSIVDWELSQAYRSWRRQGYDPITEIKRKWLDQICADDRETFFFVGDQHKWPGKFLILGAFWPRFAPDRNQLALPLS